MSDPRIVEAIDPDEAFSILSDGTRIEILRALWEAERHESTFSVLRDAVGVRDSGQFNYHLGKLTGRFVRKTDHGYELRPAGQHVVGSLLAGAYTKADEIEPTPVEEPCPSCGGDMAFGYENERASVECEGCGFHTKYAVPPGVFAGYDADELPGVAERYTRTVIDRFRHGFCRFCEGAVHPTVRSFVEVFEESDSDVGPDLAIVHYECDRCAATFTSDLGTTLLTTPIVSSFYADRGIDTREVPIWRFSTVDEDRSRILDRDPFRAAVTYTAGNDRLTLTLDRSIDVIGVDRTDNG